MRGSHMFQGGPHIVGDRRRGGGVGRRKQVILYPAAEFRTHRPFTRGGAQDDLDGLLDIAQLRGQATRLVASTPSGKFQPAPMKSTLIIVSPRSARSAPPGEDVAPTRQIPESRGRHPADQHGRTAGRHDRRRADAPPAVGTSRCAACRRSRRVARRSAPWARRAAR